MGIRGIGIQGSMVGLKVSRGPEQPSSQKSARPRRILCQNIVRGTSSRPMISELGVDAVSDAIEFLFWQRSAFDDKTRLVREALGQTVH